MLQREFGISAQEALLERPAWEIENLIAQYVRDEQAAAAAREGVT